jgi:hypothetical protein
MEAADSLDTEAVADALGKVSIDGLAGKVKYGGAEDFGLPRAFVTPMPVGEIRKGGDGIIIEEVYVGQPGT